MFELFEILINKHFSFFGGKGGSLRFWIIRTNQLTIKYLFIQWNLSLVVTVWGSHLSIMVT